MKINQALKKKNELVKQVNVLKQRLIANNQWVTDTTPTYDAAQVMRDYLTKVNELIELKAKISIATQPMFQKILTMGETKTYVEVLKLLPVSNNSDTSSVYGSRRRSYTSEAVIINYTVKVTERERDKLVEDYEKKIMDIQDELDHFNATTDI